MARRGTLDSRRLSAGTAAAALRRRRVLPRQLPRSRRPRSPAASWPLTRRAPSGTAAASARRTPTQRRPNQATDWAVHRVVVSADAAMLAASESRSCLANAAAASQQGAAAAAARTDRPARHQASTPAPRWPGRRSCAAIESRAGPVPASARLLPEFVAASPAALRAADRCPLPCGALPGCDEGA